MQTFSVVTKTRAQMVDITSQVLAEVKSSGIKSGLCVIHVPHTTAGITINEHADPDVAYDILARLEKMVPWDDNYCHNEGNSAAHIKTSLLGSSLTLIIEEGQLKLGTWQGIFLAEFDGPRTRNYFISFIKQS